VAARQISGGSRGVAASRSAAKTKTPDRRLPALTRAKRPTSPSPKGKGPKGKAPPAGRDTRARAIQGTQQKLRAAKEKERLQKEREKQKREAAKEKERLQKEREKQKREAAREKERLQKEREKQKREAAREKERLQKEHEKQKREAAKEREKERLKAVKEKERLAREREAAKIAARREKEALRAREKAEREAERAREKAEREAERERLREETRRKKEEERTRREAEREAYRKAKEAEQARIRAEREAARRALEGRIARAVGRANRAGQGRSTTRVYSPASIPNQSGTRRGLESDPLAGRFSSAEPRDETGPIRRTLPPPPPPPPPATIEERYAVIKVALQNAGEAFRKGYEESLLMSWIYHDSALEGGVYTYEELKTAIDPNMTVVPDSSLQSVCDEIRRHKLAIELVLDLAEKKRTPFTIDTIKRIYLTLHPEEGDLKTVKYRKDIPQHRLYFHEYAAPDKIAYKVRQTMDWLNGPEAKKLKSPIRIAARVHYDLLRVFPFATDSGKVARLVMNLLLLRADCPPAIIHSTERQRYYEALRSSLPTLVTMINEAIINSLSSIEKRLEEHASHKHALIS
jgi:hypothetical protein